MMNSSCRAAIYTALTGLLAAGAITMGVTAASANTAGFCSASSTSTVKATCTVTEKISTPADITVSITMESGAQQTASSAWTAICDTEKTSGGSTSMTPVTEDVTMATSNPASCTVTATGTLSTNSGTMLVALKYDPASASPSPSPTTPSGPVRVYRGLGGKCVDDAGNSSALRAKVVIWTCNSHDAAQKWVFSGGKLMHNGMCLNDQRSGGNGSKVILYTCNGGANELWTHKSNGEFVMKANGGKYCLDDPASSTHNGTQLIVWTCKNGTNQHWFTSLG
jgi:Ricin-type beta-trefoil lectin domain